MEVASLFGRRVIRYGADSLDATVLSVKEAMKMSWRVGSTSAADLSSIASHFLRTNEEEVFIYYLVFCSRTQSQE
jgi:hypothetical protein